jgi:hypothetical protein
MINTCLSWETSPRRCSTCAYSKGRWPATVINGKVQVSQLTLSKLQCFETTIPVVNLRILLRPKIVCTITSRYRVGSLASWLCNTVWIADLDSTVRSANSPGIRHRLGTTNLTLTPTQTVRRSHLFFLSFPPNNPNSNCEGAPFCISSCNQQRALNLAYFLTSC